MARSVMAVACMGVTVRHPTVQTLSASFSGPANGVVAASVRQEAAQGVSGEPLLSHRWAHGHPDDPRAV